MQAWGYSAEEAQASTDKLVAGIDGLPTTLNDITDNVRTLVTSGLSLGNATDVALGLNNALLANGASSEVASSALEQYSQMLAVGKVDQMAWNSLVRGAGKTINTMAEELLGAGANQATLYKAMQDGTVTFDQFNAKLVELSEAEGGLAEQALTGSEGVRTSMGILKTAITNGVAGSITKIDELSQKLSGKTFAQNIASIKPVISKIFETINKQFDKIPALIEKVRPYINVLKDAFNDLKAPIADAVGAVKESLAELTGSFGSEKSVSGFKSFVSGITDVIKGLADFVKDNSDVIAKVISMLPKLAAAFVGFKIGKGILSPLLTFGKGIATVAGAVGKLGGNLFGGLLGGKGSTQAADPAQALSPVTSMSEVLTGLVKKAGSLALVFGVIKIIEEAAQALKDINDKVPGNLLTLAPKLANMAIALVGMGALVVAAGKYAEKNPAAAIAGLAMVAVISAELMLAAEAMQQIDSKVPDGIGNFAKKLANMAIAISGMGALVAVAGVLAQSNPVAAIAGLAMIAGISLELMLAAEAMAQVDSKVPDNIGNFASKMANMAIAIAGMGVLVAAVGALMATGVGAIIAAGGLITIALIAGELMLVAEAIQQMNDKVPDDLSSVKTKIENIAEVIGYFTGANLGSVLDLFNNTVGAINTGVVTAGIQKFIDLADTLAQFEGITIPAGIDTKIQDMQDVIASMDGATFEQLISNCITTVDFGVVKDGLDKLIEIGQTFEQFKAIKFSKTAIETKIKDIQDVIGYLGNESGGIFSKLRDLVSNKIDSGSLDTAKESFAHLVSIGESIVALNGINFVVNDITGKVEDINAVIEALGTSGIAEYFGSMLKAAELGEVKNALDAMYSLIDPINQIAGVEVQGAEAAGKIALINYLIELLGSSDLIEYFGSMLKAAELGEVKESFTALNELVATINEFAGSGEIQSGAAIAKIGQIKTVLASLSGLEGGEITIAVTGFNGLAAAMNSVASAAQACAGALSTVSSTATASMTSMQTTATSAMTAVGQAATTGMAMFNAAISSGMSQAVATVNAGKASIVAAFNGLRSQMQSAGLFAMSGLAVGIRAGSASAIAAARSVANQISATISSALRVASPSKVMIAIGQFVSQGLAKGILSAKDMVASASDTLSQLAIPNNLATVSASGTITSEVQLDDSDIANFKASASNKVVVNNKQVTPQVSIYVDNNNGNIDEDDLLRKFEDKILEIAAADMG